MDGKRTPNESTFFPINGDGTKELIWSVSIIKSPASTFSLIPPAAFVKNKIFAPSKHITRTVQGILDEQGRERGYHLIWIEHDLMDPRTVSRKTMRDKVNEYMRTVMRAEPVDPTLLDFDDEICM